MKFPKTKDEGFLRQLFIPHYDELSLYLMSYVMVLFFLVNNPPTNWFFYVTTFKAEDILLVLMFLPNMAGMFLSLYHAFSERKKTLIEKNIMLLYAVLLCGFSGIWGGTYMLVHSPNLLLVFPVWNILCGGILLSALRYGEITEDNISDDDVSLHQVLKSTIIITLLFTVTYIVAKLNWATTLSICIVWAINLERPINQIFLRENMKT